MLFEWSLEDIPKSFHGNHFFCFLRINPRKSSCRIDKLSRMVIRDRSYSHKLPSFKPRLVQNDDEFRRIQVARKYFVFPLLHHN